MTQVNFCLGWRSLEGQWEAGAIVPKTGLGERLPWEKPKNEVTRTGRGQPDMGPQAPLGAALGAGSWSPQKTLPPG